MGQYRRHTGRTYLLNCQNLAAHGFHALRRVNDFKYHLTVSRMIRGEDDFLPTSRNFLAPLEVGKILLQPLRRQL